MLFGLILAQDGARLPAERRYAIRKKTPKEGVLIPESLHSTVMKLVQTSANL